MADQEQGSIRLQVAAAKPQDVGKGTARLAIHGLRVREGDVVELVGKRTTAAIALRPYPDDEGLGARLAVSGPRGVEQQCLAGEPGQRRPRCVAPQ